MLRGPDEYALATRRLLERLAEQNVQYAEITLAAGTVLWRELDFGLIFDAVTREAAKSPVEVRWILDAVRQFGAEHGMDVARLAVEFPRLTENMVALLVERMRRLVALVEDLSFRTVSARIAKILLESATGGFGGARLTQREMAAMAGTAREVVGRSLKYLEESGAIHFDKHRIVISRKATLEALAGVGET